MGAAAVDGFGHVGNALVDRRDRLRGALGQRGGEEGEPRSIDWIACAAPSVSDAASVPRRSSMVSVTDFARVSKVISSDFSRPSMVSSNDLILLSSEVSRLATRVPSVVSNCSRRWSSEAVISPLFEIRRVSKVST